MSQLQSTQSKKKLQIILQQITTNILDGCKLTNNDVVLKICQRDGGYQCETFTVFTKSV